MKNKIAALVLVFISVTGIFFFSSIETGNNQAFKVGKIGCSALTRISPIVITHDDNWSLYASSGSGLSYDPWVIEDFLIECNGTGAGIIVQNTTDYAKFRNGYVNESGATALDIGIACFNASHLIFQNVTSVANGNAGFAFVNVTNSYVYGCNFSYNPTNCYVEGSYNIDFIDTLMKSSNSSFTSYLIGVLFSGNFSHDIYFYNCDLNNGSNTITYGIDGLVFEKSIIGHMLISQGDNVNLTGCYVDDSIQLIGLRNLSISDTLFNNSVNHDYNLFSTAIASVTGRIDITNTTFMGAGGALSLVAPASAVYANVTVRNCTFVGGSCFFFKVQNVTVEDSVFRNDTGVIFYYVNSSLELRNNWFNYTQIPGVPVQLIYCQNALVENNTLLGNATNAISLTSVSYYRVVNNYIEMILDQDAIEVLGGGISSFIGNYIKSPSITPVLGCDAGIWFDIGGGADNCLIANNTFEGINDPVNGNGIIWFTGYTNITVIGNWFIDCSYAFAIPSGATPTNVTGNYFMGNSAIFNPGSSSLPVSMERNYYRDYFDRYPYAITKPGDWPVLEYEYVVTTLVGGLNDSEPLYYAPWFPNSKEISFFIYSSVDQIGITFEWFKLYVNGLITPRQYRVPSYVLYNITVKDFANRVLYHHEHNVNASDAVEIGLPITTLVIKNDFNHSVQFTLIKDGYSTVFPIAGGQSISLRVILGTFSYYVSDEDGNIYKDAFGRDISKNVDITGPAVVSFGFTSIAPGQINNYTSSLLDYVIVAGILGGAFAVVIYLGTRKRQQQQAKRSSKKSSFNFESISKGLERIAR